LTYTQLKNMELKVTDVKLEGLDNARFVKPYAMRYTLGGSNRRWELLHVHDSVAVVIYNKDQRKLVFVRQFRPAAFVKNYATKNDLDLDAIVNDQLPNSGTSKDLSLNDGDEKLGMTMELCAGIVDKTGSPAEIAVSEVFEETGYSIKTENLVQIRSFKSNLIGTVAAITHLFYTEVTDEQRTGSGGGLASECIQVIHLTEEETQQMLDDDSVDKPLGLIYALQWRKMKQAGLL